MAGRCERLAWVASSSVEREGEKLINTCLGVDRREESIKHAPFSKHTGAGPGTDWGGSGVCHVKYVGRRGRSEQCAQKVTQPARHERDPALEERPVWEDRCRSRGPRGPATDAEGKQTERGGAQTERTGK